MKLTHILFAATAFASASALAGGDQQRSQSDPSQQQSSASQGGKQQSSRSQSSQSPEMIKQVQEKLSAAGYDAGPADGKLGPKTQQAITSFQGAKGLQASGKLDSETLAALQGEGSASTGSSSSSNSSGASPEQSNTGTSGPASSGSVSERSAEPKPSK